jgi:hypothetical protein
MTEENLDSTATQPEGDTADATETTPPGNDLPGGEETTQESNADLPGGEAGSQETTEAAGAPEAYAEFDLSAGKDIDYKMSDSQKEEFIKFGKEQGFDDAKMASLINFDIERNKALAEENAQFVKTYGEEGLAASRKEHGEKFAALHAKNGQVYNKFFPEEARKTLNDMGISSQPWFFNALKSISAVMSEDTTVPGDGGATEKTLRDTFAYVNKDYGK